MLEFIQTVVYDVTGKKGLTLDTDFVQDLELNSFDVMNMVSIFEDHFKIKIPTRDVWKLRKVSHVINYLSNKGIYEA